MRTLKLALASAAITAAFPFAALPAFAGDGEYGGDIVHEAVQDKAAVICGGNCEAFTADIQAKSVKGTVRFAPKQTKAAFIAGGNGKFMTLTVR